MPRLHICSLARVTETVRATGARSLVTLLNVETLVSRPAEIDPERHLYIRIGDITEPLDGHILPAEEHVGGGIGEGEIFAEQMDRYILNDAELFDWINRGAGCHFLLH